MYAQLAAVGEITEFLTGLGLKHFVIGGIANAIWGQPRATLDADFKVIIGHRSISEVVVMLGDRFQFRVADPVAFAQDTYVAPIQASNQIAVDIVLGFLPYEEQAIARAVPIQHEGVSFVVCTAEDLIIQKAISEREQDWSDIEGVLIRQGPDLDQEYVIRWLEQFAQTLQRLDIVQRYRNLKNRTSGA